MHLGIQRWLKHRLLNMLCRHPLTATGQGIVFNKAIGLIQGNYACVGAMSLSWPTETAGVVDIGHCNAVAQA